MLGSHFERVALLMNGLSIFIGLGGSEIHWLIA
jgi:hypothetical protein